MNSEAIFVKAFASPDKAHNFDYAMAAPSFKIDWGTNTSPTLELVESYEYIDGTPGTLKTTDASGNLIYYENAEDIFKDKDPCGCVPLCIRCLLGEKIRNRNFGFGRQRRQGIKDP